MEKVESFLDKKNWAVVGVTPSKFKFGYKIWNILKKNGYKVYPVNPYYEEIEGERAYSSLSDIDGEVDVVNFVIPPKVTEDYLDELEELGIEYIWFQPDTFNDAIISWAKDRNINYIDEDCILKVLLEKNK